VRNQIAGYITHLIRVREKMQEKGAESVEEVQE
jgi:ribosomal protein S17E